MAFTVEKGLTYNLVMQAPALLGTAFSNVTVEGVVNYSLASMVQPDLAAVHQQVLPYLTLPGVPTDAAQLSWIVIITPSNARRVVALEWLAAQPELATYRNKIIRLNQPTPAQVNLIRDILVTSGVTNFTVEDAP